MKKFITLTNLLLLSILTLSAQNIRMKVTLKNGDPFVQPADNVSDITFEVIPLEDLYPNLNKVKLIEGSDLLWSTINYGAQTANETGIKTPWSQTDDVLANWSTPYESNEWRTPTKEEMEELIKGCDWTQDGPGYWVSNKSDPSLRIYIPNTINYWTSTPRGDDEAYAMKFTLAGPESSSSSRTMQFAIRPVWGDPAFSAKVEAKVISTGFYNATVQLTVSECNDMSMISGYGVSGDINQKSETNTISLECPESGRSYTIQGYITATGVSKNIESPNLTFTTLAKTLNVSTTATADSYDKATVNMTITGNALETVNYTIKYGKEDENDYPLTKTGSVTLTTTSGQNVVEHLDGLDAEANYKYLVTVQYAKPNTAETTSSGTFTTPNESNLRAIDLGLSVKWANLNVGAEDEIDYGGHYGWGDATGENRSTRSGQYAPGKQFTTIGGDPEYDIAAAKLEGNWRLPTGKEIEELNQCNPTFVSKTAIKDGIRVSVDGWLLTGINDCSNNSIFIPCAGVRTGSSDTSMEDVGRYAYIWSDSVEVEGIFYTIGYTMQRSVLSKARGLSIRAVYDDGTRPTPVDPYFDPTNEVIEGSDQDETTGIIPQDGVDMGIGNVKWSRWNFGVKNKTSEYGRYYAWGEMEEKSEYWDTNYTESLKGKEASEFENFSFGDDYDVVKQTWKGDWRIPTAGELAELVNNCTVQWTQEVSKGPWGYKLTSNINGNTLFFPAGGSKVGASNSGVDEMGRYWSRSAYAIGDSGKTSGYATTMEFSRSSKPSTSGIWRYYGLLIRPVKEK